jgi:diaminohydroxyphosphoribosylaminopyrimidine deaminase/5-amino-6-(5-phosphoribosylamino)uracil reductase
MADLAALRLALDLARSVEGRTSPRPPVGAVLVRNGEIVGRGATTPPFGPHAEVVALEEAGARARQADLYVTLEPCCISGHTPPCTEAIIAAGVRRVIVAARDPNPRVDGRGLMRLRSAGLEVRLLAEEPATCTADEVLAAQALLRPFATVMRSGRAYVTAKWAMSLDGRIATHTGDAFWISGPAARTWVHDLRDRVDAIMIGAGTARRDDPSLTVRLPPDERRTARTPRPQPPLRVVLSSRGDLPATLRLLARPEEGETWVLIGAEPVPRWHSLPEQSGVRLLRVASDALGRVSLTAALQLLAREGRLHVLLEGGATLLGSAFDEGCIDHVVAVVAPCLIGGAGAPAALAGAGVARLAQACRLVRQRSERLDEDLLIEGDVVYPAGTHSGPPDQSAESAENAEREE